MAAPDVSAWNDHRRNNNCYAFAFDHMQPGADAKLQPGQLSGLTPLTDRQYNCHDMMARVVADNPGVTVLDGAAGTPPGTYRVALVLDTQGANRDYHFYREVEPGAWLHKPGSLRVSDVDDAGRAITDPRTADRDYVNDGPEDAGFNYSTYCGMFAVPYDGAPRRQSPTAPLLWPMLLAAVLLAALAVAAACG
jgi:hypothetical protein